MLEFSENASQQIPRDSTDNATKLTVLQKLCMVDINSFMNIHSAISQHKDKILNKKFHQLNIIVIINQIVKSNLILKTNGIVFAD